MEIVITAAGVADLGAVARVLRGVQQQAVVQPLGAGEHAAQHHSALERAGAEHAVVGGLGAGAGIDQAGDGSEHVTGLRAQVPEETGVGAGAEQQQVRLLLRRSIPGKLDETLHDECGGGHGRGDQAHVPERFADRVVVDHQRRQSLNAGPGFARAVGGGAVQDDGRRIAGAVVRGHAGLEAGRQGGDLRPGERALAEGARLLAAASQEAGERQGRGQAVRVRLPVAEQEVGVVIVEEPFDRRGELERVGMRHGYRRWVCEIAVPADLSSPVNGRQLRVPAGFGRETFTAKGRAAARPAPVRPTPPVGRSARIRRSRSACRTPPGSRRRVRPRSRSPR